MKNMRSDSNDTRFSNFVMEGKHWCSVIGSLKLSKIRDLILKMFLEGRVETEPLRSVVPKTSLSFFLQELL